MKGAVLGHSLVAGLLDHLSYRRWHACLSALQVARKILCSTKVLEMHLIGERGASAIGYSVPPGLNDIRLTFCMLHFGCNDHVDHVAICSVLPSTRSFQHGGVAQYCAQIRKHIMLPISFFLLIYQVQCTGNACVSYLVGQVVRSLSTFYFISFIYLIIYFCIYLFCSHN